MRRSHGHALFTLALLATPALAQEAKGPDFASEASADWQMMLTAQGHVARSVSAIVQENEKLKAEIARRDAEAKKAAEQKPAK